MTTDLAAILFDAQEPVPYPRAWGWQRQLQARLLANPDGPEALLLLEHQRCYTLGRGASEVNLHFDPLNPPDPLFRVDRGGEVTHHLPGQLVLYPIINLQRHGSDLHLYLRQLEAVVIDVLIELGLNGTRREGFTGVWLEGHKVAAIGVGTRRWISQHGLALNITCPLEGFGAIVPCGITDRPVGRLCTWQPEISCEVVRPLLVGAFSKRFGVALRQPRTNEQLDGW